MPCAACANAPDAACTALACPFAAAYRLSLLAYLDLQLTADLAAALWLPIVAAGAALACAPAPRWTWLAVALCTPAALAVCARRMTLRAPEVALERVVALFRARLLRQRTAFYRHRHAWERFETYVTNPLLFGVLVAGAARALQLGDARAACVACALLVFSVRLYLGPSRRLRESPVADLPAFLAAADADRASGRLPPRATFFTRDGTIRIG